MADSKKHRSEADRWKDKYLELAEELEKKEALSKDFIDILQRLLVRVSLAADGLDQRLDRELEALRQQLKSNAIDKTDLANRLAKIEKAVLSLDEQKESDAEIILKSLEKLVDQLLMMNLERDQKKHLKKLLKDLKGKQASLKDYPQLLSQFAQLQASAIQAQLLDGGERKAGGFFQRLFRPGEVETVSSDATSQHVHSDEQKWQSVPASEMDVREGDFIPGQQHAEQSSMPPASQPDTIHSASHQEKTYIQMATELDITVEDNEHESSRVPGFSTISKRVTGALNHLIGQLSVPEDAQGQASKIQQQIDKGLNWYELGPTLDDVANLVISAVSRAQNEFESFLKSLDARLAKLQGFLLESKNQQLGWKGNSLELDRSVRSEVSSISKEVAEATDLKELKSSVEIHLDSIVHSMDAFILSEEKREQESNEQVEKLKKRLMDMEGEATQIRAKLQEEHKRAMTDTLTQLPNREAFNERMNLEYERWLRYRQPATLVVADIDLFKRVNDQYGHLAGDKVLQIIAKEIKSRIRKTDFLARFGGEEFVVIMPETTEEMAYAVIEKTREMIGRLPFHFRNEDVQITMSFGIVSFQDDISETDLFDIADKALYKAKKDGRNRISIAGKG